MSTHSAILMGLILAASPLSHAALIRLDISGPIDFSHVPLQSTFAVGQQVQFSVTYETTTPIQTVISNQAFRINAIRKFTLNSGTYSTEISGSLGQIVVYNNLSGFDGVQFQIAANSATYQFTNPKPATGQLDDHFGGGKFDHFFVNLSTNNTALYDSYDLPVSYDLADYPSTQNGIFRFSDGEFSMGFANISATVVPEPSSMLCFLSGVALILRRRRR